MAVGEKIVSVFNGAADKDAYNEVALVPKERTIKHPSDAKRRKLENLYQQVRDIRDTQGSATNGSARFGKRSRPSTLTIGCSRWRSSKSSTRPRNSPR